MESTIENQLAKLIYHRVMSVMKFTLSLEEYSYREQGRNDPRYKTFKQQLMSNTYENLRELFGNLAELGLMEKTIDDEDVKGGFRPSISGGSGYVNSVNLQKWLDQKTK